ncbi:MAG: ribosome hibernation-promoting factor, HPF/YfiA family [Acidimicrobiales bacterium]
MEITVSSRHTDISDALRAATEEKISRLTRFLEGMDRAEVHFFEERNPRIADKEVCEVTLEGHGHHVRCKVAAPDGFAAVDRAVEKLEHQLQKLKTKLVRRKYVAGRREADNHRALTVVQPEGDEGEAGDADTGPRIVKTKAFQMKPMTPDEALLQMDMLGHDFFMFTNAETDRAAVLYRRADGDVGLIDQA